MKLLIVLSALALCAAAFPEDSSEQVRSKRGVLGYPAAVSYSSQVIHHTPSIPVIHAPVVKYVAPLPAVKVVQPYPITKIIAPAVSYTKVAYPSPIFPHYGYGYGFSHYH